MPYHVPSRDAFCKYWKQLYGPNGQILEQREGGRALANANGTPLTPTATAYVAYLYRTGLANNLYHFTNVLVHGSRPHFVKAQQEQAAQAESESSSATPMIQRRTQGQVLRAHHRAQRRIAERRFDQAAIIMKENAENPESSSAVIPKVIRKAIRTQRRINERRRNEKRRLVKGQESQLMSERPTERKLPKGGGGGGGGGGDDPPPECAAVGEEAKKCGAKGKHEDICCGTAICNPDGSGFCVEAPYGGGTIRKLSLSEPGLLVEG